MNSWGGSEGAREGAVDTTKFYLGDQVYNVYITGVADPSWLVVPGKWREGFGASVRGVSVCASLSVGRCLIQKTKDI